jgi:glycosyltransferase involved in cell wall biosynthesis
MASPGRVLIVVENLPVPFDRRVWMEATTLARAGYDVTVISPKGKGFRGDHEVIDGVAVHRHDLVPEGHSALTYLREYADALRAEALLASRVYRERPFDVLHVCNPPDLMFLFAAWYRLRHGVRVVFDHHDINPELYEAKYGRRDTFYWLLRLAERFTFLTANVVITTGESYRAIALGRGRKRPEDVFVVRSGPDLARFQAVEPVAAYRRGRPHLVGYVGVMGPQEGIDYLLRAAKIIVADLGRTDVSFMLIGDGPAAAGLRALALELGIADHVEFTGRVPDVELVARLSSCDICVNPDPYNTFNDASVMNKILEYMALGRAVVQFDLTEGRRSAGAASAYARPNDVHALAQTIVGLLDDDERRAQMAAEGHRRMRDDLEWRHQIPKLLQAYARALGDRPGRAARNSGDAP